MKRREIEENEKQIIEVKLEEKSIIRKRRTVKKRTIIMKTYLLRPDALCLIGLKYNSREGT
jgi:hypothetical protein